MDNTGEILFYTTDNWKINIDVRFSGETVWLSQKQMSDLFWVDTSTINIHLKNIYETKELSEDSTIWKFQIVQNEWNREVRREVNFYNLDAIISVWYRVNSQQATYFRQWATKTLREYIIKGFVLDDERLKNWAHFWKDYFDELLEKIREIRASERRFYQKITDIYATSSDYDKDAQITKDFFATVQNKLIYAITHSTAPEIIYSRANADKINMWLTNRKWDKKGEKILKTDVTISKNYLDKDELDKLNLLVSQLLDFAEFQVKNQIIMTMRDWVKSLELFLKTNRVDVLQDKWKISKEDADKKALWEYKKFREKQDRDYLSDFDRFLEESKHIKNK